jgi:hypothetical protein
MKSRLLSLLAAVLFVAPFAVAQTPQFCNTTVIDQAKVIKNPQAVAAAASTLINNGANVHVVTVNSASFAKYGQLAGVESYLESQCPSWTTNGTRSANLYVIMVAPNERAKNIFLGSYYVGSFDVASTYSNLANASFHNGDFGGGIVSTLNGTSNMAINFRKRTVTAQQQRQPAPTQRAYTPTPTVPPSYPYQDTPQQASGDSHIVFWIFGFLILGLVAVTLYFLFRRGNGTDTYSTGPSTSSDPYVDSSAVPPSSSYPSSRTYAARAPSSGGPTVIHEHTTYVDNSRYDSNGNLLTGILVGEAIAGNRQPVIVNNPPVYGSPTYVEPTPSYVPDAPAAPVVDAPDSSWQPQQEAAAPTYEEPAAETTSFEEPSQETTSFEAPSEPTDFGSSNNDTGF